MKLFVGFLLVSIGVAVMTDLPTWRYLLATNAIVQGVYWIARGAQS